MQGCRNITRTGAIVFGSLSLAGFGLYVLIDELGGGGGELLVPPIGLGLAAIGLGVVSISINMHLPKKRQAFVNFYNE